MRPFVSFKNVSHEYGADKDKSVKALSDVNFDIAKHEFVAVVGPSGCGKSTLLRLLSGLLIPTSGGVEIFGHRITEPRDEIGIVFQKPTLLPWLNIRENVVFPSRHKRGRVSRQEYERAEELIKSVGLKDFAECMPEELSGGMQQRVGIARALLMDPEILIMDEPFSALDALTREEMGFELLQIWNERPKTVLFITHSISEAVLLSDRVLIMSPRPGTLVEEINVELPRPRSSQTIRHPKFNEYTDQIRQHIYHREEAKIA
ncbi:ABC transporter ATP-binding protein [Marinobacterium stanieri]|uniref:NitT/TauT family transport system ATP-binding protein n=1 Tax=Marinobacterium stanieri TaxID=49186 RepID=A0A1N6NXL8_9GAMM|nr:ABC transporter ATP-binding protein [Marinobacterium stanieri]SIP96793.1 NitT/TauT family transport system ATP-binding protein [Marinobacterium stanieri]